MRLVTDTKLDFSDVLMCPKRSTLGSRKEANLIRKFTPKYGQKFEGIPVIASNMATGNFFMHKILSSNKMFTAIAKHHNKKWVDELELNSRLLYGFYTIGMKEDELQELKQFHTWLNTIDSESNMLKICIDIANGYTQKFSDFVSKVRDTFPQNVIVAGNVCTSEAVEHLILSGADYVKVGIGPGAFCTTRKKTGVGYPQFSAGCECSDSAHGLGGGIILDGGCQTPGDVCKALGTGADMVMIGTMLAGTNECDGEIIEKYFNKGEVTKEGAIIITTEKFKQFYGMSSVKAQEAHFGGKKDYRTSEGREDLVPYTGPVQDIIDDLCGGIRSMMTYIGARNIKDVPKCATFSIVKRQHSQF
jgi:GMP reductase